MHSVASNIEKDPYEQFVEFVHKSFVIPFPRQAKSNEYVKDYHLLVLSQAWLQALCNPVSILPGYHGPGNIVHVQWSFCSIENCPVVI